MDILTKDNLANELTLDQYKSHRYDEIDSKTFSLISEGFTHDSIIFSLSDNAQKNWVNKYADRANLVYPHVISTKDPASSYSIANQTAYESFYASGTSAVETIVKTGREIRISIGVAVDREAAEAITDAR